MSKNILNLVKVLGLAGLIFIAGCNKDDKDSNIKVGKGYEGGIIAYVDGSGKHGLIAAPSDLDGVYFWGRAFTVCEELVIDGYDDWYLPSKEELNTLYKNKDAIGGFTEDIYWCSTELEKDGNGAWAQRFSDGKQDTSAKKSERKVRAVRSF